MSRRIRLCALASVKGGVGKSTLAVTIAKVLAADSRRPVVIDADLTGTSLADGLRLCAPVVGLREDGNLDLDAEPSGRHHDADETIALRNKRKVVSWADRAPPPAYLNDALTYSGVPGDSDCKVGGLLWRHERDDGVRYLPSSPLSQDVGMALGWIQHPEPFRWLQRFTWVLDALVRQVPDVTDIVVDLSPGIWGLSHETLVLMAALSTGERLPEGYPPWPGDIVWDTRPFLVTTPDLNDLLPALEYVAAQSARLPALDPILNRAAEAIENIRGGIRRKLGPTLGSLGIEEKIVPADAMPKTLGKIFVDQDLSVDKEMKDLVRRLLEEKP